MTVWLENLFLQRKLTCSLVQETDIRAAIRVASIRETHSLLKLTLTHLIVLTSYTLGCCYCISACLLYFGHTIFNDPSCRAALYLGLVFYLGQKYCLYLFLVERTHIVKATLQSRSEDRVYLIGLTFVIIGYSTLAISMFLWHISNFDKNTAICHIGLVKPVAIALLVWDIIVNVFLTIVFLANCRQYMIKGLRASLLSPNMLDLLKRLTFYNESSNVNEMIATTISQDTLIRVLRKALWGCLGVLASTVTNFAILLHFAGNEEVWVFFTFTTLDGTVQDTILILFHEKSSTRHTKWLGLWNDSENNS